MPVRPTTVLSDAPDPGLAYRQLWGDQGSINQDGRTGPGDGADVVVDGDDGQAPHLQLAGFSPVDDLARAGVRAYFQANPQAKRNVRNNLRGIVGSGFSDREIDQIADDFLDGAGTRDIGVLTGITGSTPQDITPRQKATIDAIIAHLPNRQLNQRAIASYRGALAHGSLRVR